MKKSVFIVFVTLLFASGCVEKTGYYSDGEENVISLICDNTWVTDKTVNDDGTSWHGIYNYEKDGTYSRKLITTDNEGDEKVTNIIYGRWAFTDQSSKTIYFGSDHYWDIEVLTSKKFEVYDRWGEYGYEHMSRDYLKLTPLK